MISIPTFVTGPLLVLGLGIHYRWLPVGAWTSWKSLILPAITLAGPYTAYIARLMRSSLLEVLSQDSFGKRGSVSTHLLAIDSKGTIYTTELDRGTQKFIFKGLGK